QMMLDHYGLPLEGTVAFGDGGNDINMLRYVPMGIAMGNATDEVKSAANYVTDTVDNDGVEKAFRYLGI
ncbi:MAG: HAD hydrolase family protein, partial [Bacteroidaceae bacterium]|nr:HAD hydrolase family protein [Bacteroidaceae bacterium]